MKAIELLKKAKKSVSEDMQHSKFYGDRFGVCLNTYESAINEALAELENLGHRQQPCKTCAGSGRVLIKDIACWHIYKPCSDCQPEAGELSKELKEAFTEIIAHKRSWEGNDTQLLILAKVRLDRQAEELKDTRLELACPETVGSEGEELYKVAATVMCEKHRLAREIKRLKELLESIYSRCRNCDHFRQVKKAVEQTKEKP